MSATITTRGYDWRANAGRAFERLHATEYGVTTNDGFTAQEHLDEVYLIHMNGRVYDYRLGRFLSVDPIISNPANSQSVNPYSYLGNNPLSGLDPTGYAGICVQDTGTHVCGGIVLDSAIMDGYRGQTVHPQVRNGATGQGSRLANPNPSDHGGRRISRNGTAAGRLRTSRVPHQ